jgi:hypothetical protein
MCEPPACALEILISHSPDLRLGGSKDAPEAAVLNVSKVASKKKYIMAISLEYFCKNDFFA